MDRIKLKIMGKETQKVKKYSYLNALMASMICGAIAFGVNSLIVTKVIKHQFDFLFAPVAVAIALCIINFKVLSKLSLFLLPPAMGILGVAPVIGIFLVSQLGFDAQSTGDTLRIIIQAFPFLVVASFVHKWYAGLAGKNSFISYALFSIGTVVTSFLIFKEGLDFEWIIAGYFAFASFEFSRLHVGTILG